MPTRTILSHWRWIAATCMACTGATWALAEPDADPDPAGKLPPAAKRKVDFVADIRPLFRKHCYECHGEEMQESGLRLDRRADALAGGDSGRSIIPGKSAESLLVHYVAGTDPDVVMPPDGRVLSDEQIGLLRAWIDQGAVWPDGADDGKENSLTHWAFRPIDRPEVPRVSAEDAAWVENPIDAFVLRRLREKGIAPSPEADRVTLMRRLSLDLLGLPPDPAEVDAFVNDPSPDAYERLVDRLLQSPHFGERWGRHWLDKARYADSDGYEKDRPRPNAWRYRNWVIDAINADLPFDEFTIQQLAGDLLPEATPETRLATAFHRQTLTNTEGGTDQEQFRVEAVFDRVDTTGTVWLGLTVGCARCHSHKYDPITQREYYRLFAFFNNGDETETEVPISDVHVALYKRQKAEHDRRLAALQAKLDARRNELRADLDAWAEKLAERLADESQKTIRFHPVKVVSARSEGGATLQPQEDGSWLVTGKNPERDRYILTVRAEIPELTGLRLEVLADDRLPSKGPGRVAHGNFVLNEIRLRVGQGEKLADARDVPLAAIRADFSQKGWAAGGAIDGNEKTGWAIAPQFGRDHWAVLTTQAPVLFAKGTHLEVVLSQQYGTQHTIGRFRILAMTGTDPAIEVPEDVRQILALAPAKRTPAQRERLLAYRLTKDAPAAELNAQLEKLRKAAPASPMMKVRVISQRTNNPRKTHVLRRGDFLQPQDEVQPGTLRILHPLKPRQQGQADRLDLARWLVDPANPLTPRVVVNHVWHQLFGKGLVRTMNDFGKRGEPPTHPQLLDWLAREYIRRGWSRKSLIRLIVTSATYRQSSRHRPELVEIDPENRLLHRQNRFRVEGEIVRDLHLAASGLLSEKIGGPSVFPPMPADVAALSYANNFRWNTSKGEDRYRRGMYTFFKRTAPHPNLMTFDCPSSNTTCVERTLSNTPLQALTTLNNEVFVEASRALARRILEADMSADDERLVYGFRLCVARHPDAEELAALMDLLTTAREWYATHPEEAQAIAGTMRMQDVPDPEFATWVATARILVNMDEFMTRE